MRDWVACRIGERSHGSVALRGHLKLPNIPATETIVVCGFCNAIRRTLRQPNLAHITSFPQARARNCSIGENQKWRTRRIISRSEQ
jgi:hypothetical protein